MRTAAKIIVVGVSTVALAAGIGAGIAYADPPSATPTPTAAASPSPSASPTRTGQPADPDRWRPRKMRPRALVARALHGEVTLAGEGHRVVVFQRGPIDKVSDTSLTVKSADGYTATYVVSDETVVREKAGKITVADLEAGDRVLVVATKDGSTLTAVRIRVKDS
jgi:Domain of unknown function (DUF5666)